MEGESRVGEATWREGWHYTMVLVPLLLSKLPELRDYQVVTGPRYLCRNHPRLHPVWRFCAHCEAGRRWRGILSGFSRVRPRSLQPCHSDPTGGGGGQFMLFNHSSGMADWQEVWASSLALHEERVHIKLGFRTTPPPHPGWLSELKQEWQVTECPWHGTALSTAVRSGQPTQRISAWTLARKCP